jgi:hypothetical protein
MMGCGLARRTQPFCARLAWCRFQAGDPGVGFKDAVTDWLATGTKGLDEHTVNTYRILIDTHPSRRSARSSSKGSPLTT